jgi:protein phosphatase 2C family protein 2/3
MRPTGEPEHGPLRVLPGQLSVTRTIGDYPAKKANPKAVIGEPEITKFKLTDQDFIIMCSDGVFDAMTSRDVTELAYRKFVGEDLHQAAGKVAGQVVAEAMNRHSADNITCIFIGLKGLLAESYQPPSMGKPLRA